MLPQGPRQTPLGPQQLRLLQERLVPQEEQLGQRQQVVGPQCRDQEEDRRLEGRLTETLLQVAPQAPPHTWQKLVNFIQFQFRVKLSK